MDSTKVDILLATYNGALFLEEQLESIANQSHKNWHLYIRDDESSDNTEQIIKQFIFKYPQKASFIEGVKNDRRATGNFSILMDHSKSDYIMFSDQDDIWLPSKVALSLQKIKSIESQFPKKSAYVFSDLTKIDESKNIISKSLWKAEQLNPKHTTLGRLLVQNIPYGCTTIINRRLLEIGKSIPKEALLHDHWLVLLAATTGYIDYISEPTILHRIHQSNSSRANSEHWKAYNHNTKAKVTNQNFNQYFRKLQLQATALLQRLDEKKLLSKENETLLTDFINLRSKSLLKRKILMLKHGFFKKTNKQTLKWLLRI